MADSISIVMKMTDDISSQMKSIASTSKSVSKEFEDMQRQTQQLGQRYSEFNKKSAQLHSQAASIKKAMDEAAKAFKKTGDEAEKVRFESLREEYTALTDSAKTYSTAAKATMKDISDTQNAMRKLGSSNSNPAGGIKSSLGTALRNNELLKMFSGSLSQAAGAWFESAIGQPTATMASEIASGIFSGAAAGAFLGPIGALGGAAIGGLSGYISGESKIFKAEDDAFKDYYKGLYETVTQATEEGLTSGKALAASRETDKLAFSSLLGGEENAGRFLDKLIETADTTPFQYDDLTGLSKTLLTFGYAAEDIIPTLLKVGDAGATMRLSTSDIGTVATYIGRMKSSDKASLEYLNPLMERGFGVFEWLAEDLGVSQKAVYDKISKGQLSGTYVSDLILKRFGSDEYAGQMEAMSKTTEGLASTLEGALENIEAAGGKAYNDLRNKGKQADINAYGGELGAAMKELSKVTGENRAYGENLSAQYTREALESVLLGKVTSLDFGKNAGELTALSEQYATAKAIYDSGTSSEEEKREAGLNMERIKETAEALATASYESSEWYQKVQDEELKQIDAIRENTKSLDAATNAYILGNAFTKGRGFSLADKHYIETVSNYRDSDGDGVATNLDYISNKWQSNAYGLRRVPFNGYPIIAHQDERLLTAAEAREQDRGGRSRLVVNFTGPITVRQDSDLDELAGRLADQIEQARDRAG